MNSIENLKRWIVASFWTELKSRLTGAPLFVEGDDRLTNRSANFFELRIDGPYTKPYGSKGEYCSYIEVNILATSTRDEGNRYTRENMQGIAAQALNKDFCIYKTGNVGKNAADDESLVGVMKLLPLDAIKTSDFGQIDSNTNVFQSVTEAHYEMHFYLESA